MKFSYILSALTIGLAISSCSGPVEDTSAFTLSVDKTTIEADGKDKVVFTLTDADGVALSESDLKYFFLEDVNSGVKFSKTNEFTAIANGEYTFKARYKSNESTNTVTVKAINRAKYEKFFHKVACHKVTSVNCVACPSAAKALHAVADMWKEHLVLIDVHGNFSGTDPWSIPGAADNIFINFFDRQALYPSILFNYNYPMVKENRTPSAIAGIIESQLRQHNATSGIKISSTVESNGDVKIDATLNSSTGGKYNLVFSVVVDKLEHKGGHSVNNDGMYDDVLVASSDVSAKYYTANEISLKADQEHQASTTFALKLAESKKADARVVVYSIRELEDGKIIIDNIAQAPVGQSLDYLLNE